MPDAHKEFGGWQQRLPDREGDWLWISQWSCGCCLIDNGIAWVMKAENSPEVEGAYVYTDDNGCEWHIHWGKPDRKPNFYDGHPIVTYWKQIHLPVHPSEIREENDMDYSSMHSHLHRLYGMTHYDASNFVTPFGYSLSIIEDGEEMNADGWTISVREDEQGKIKDVFAWSRPVTRQSESSHPDAWNDAWLDEKNAKILQDFLKRLKDPNDPFGKGPLRSGPAIQSDDAR